MKKEDSGALVTSQATNEGCFAFDDAFREEEISRHDHGVTKRERSTIAGAEENQAARRQRVDEGVKEEEAADEGKRDEGKRDRDDEDDDDDEKRGLPLEQGDRGHGYIMLTRVTTSSKAYFSVTPAADEWLDYDYDFNLKG